MKASPIALALTVATCGLVLPACDPPAAVAPEPIIRPVRTALVAETAAGRTRTFAGSSRPGQLSNLAFRVSGSLKTVHVNVGDKVDKGAPIATLDPSDYELQVEQAQASLAQAKAQRRNAKAQFARTRQLYESASASKADLDAARAGNDSASAAVRSIGKQLQLAKAQRGYTQLVAPLAGAIAAVHSEEGEVVAAGHPVVTLTAGSKPEVRVGVPEMLIGSVKEGAEVAVTFDALPGKELKAVVTEVGVAPEQGGSTYAVTARLVEADASVRAGLAAEVTFEFELEEGNGPRIMVPAFSVGEDDKGRYVWLVDAVASEPGFAVTRRVDVTVGELTGEGIEITEGLEAGDVLVTAGVSKINDGQRVRLP